MGFPEFNMKSIRQLNQQMIAQDSECQKAIGEMHDVEVFLSDFSFLSFGRNYVHCGKYTFSLKMISTSFEFTAGSIISCSESGCMADAYSLLRKYRDDLFFYLYIVVYDTREELGIKSSLEKHMETNIVRWVNNDLNNLHTSTVLQTIAQPPKVKDAVQKYNLKTYFDILGNRLNDYIHGNGISFYNRHVNADQRNSLQKQLQALLTDMRSITITFLFLLTLCAPFFIMSTDYVDCLDCNMTPTDGSQYWVAPFVSDFFKKNMDRLDKNCIEYLQDITHMEFV